jgi:hypothetical protein
MADDSTKPVALPSLPEYPHALRPAIAPGQANEPILLYEGPVDVSQNDKTFRSDASVSLIWLPSPRVRFEIPAAPQEYYFQLGDLSLRLDDGTAISNCLVSGSSFSNGPEGCRASIRGVIGEEVVRPGDGDVSYTLFLIPNLDAPSGRPIYYPHCCWAARLLLIGCGWKITLDAADNQEAVRNSLKSNSGFGVTQVGRLEREDGKPFTTEQAKSVSSALAWYLSFACGRWTGPCLATGFAADGTRLWQTWDISRVVPYRDRLSWMDPRNLDHLEAPFPGFLKLWLDDNWQEVIRLAIHWYIEANAQAGSIEGSIILTQTAFELLSSAVLVENYGLLSRGGYDKLAAAERIRQLFVWADIPIAIPPEAQDLTRLAGSNNWPDTSTAMTKIRNTITHPTRKNREEFGKHTNEGRLDAWSLGLWNLELCLLRLFEYRGTYGNRLKNRWAGDVEQVPWTGSTAPTTSTVVKNA